MSGRVVARVFVPGRARTKGSLKPILVRAGGKVRASLTENNPDSTAWKRTMMRALGNTRVANPLTREPHAGAVENHCFFRFERTAQVKDGMPTGAVIPSHDTPFPTSIDIGDEDKLRRNVLDALTQAHVLADDCLSVGGMNYKRWCADGEQPGVEIVVLPAPDPADVLALEKVTWVGADESFTDEELWG